MTETLTQPTADSAADAPALFKVAFDTETHRIGPGNVFPPLVCVSVWDQDGDRTLVSTYTPDELEATVATLFDGDGLLLIGQNTGFDLGVLCRHYPALLPTVFEHLEGGRISDTRIREKLLNLAEHGHLENMILPDGTSKRIQYSLSTLVLNYLGIDITDSKKGEDAWRTNYAVLEDMPVEEWPEEAQEYALNDANYTLQVYEAQEQRRQALIAERGIDPFEVETFRCMVDFALKLNTAWGVAVDPVAKAKIEAMLADALKPENLELLVKAKILTPAKPPRPYKAQEKNMESCEDKSECLSKGGDGCNCVHKWTKGTKEAISKKKLEAYILALAEKNEKVQLRYNAPTETELQKAEAEGREPQGNLCINDEWLTDYAHHDPVLEQYHARQKLQKLVTTELPRMNWTEEDGTQHTSPIVHPAYDVLKRTGRTSSYADKLYPSFNCQNVDPRARGCFVPRDGFVMFSIDYSSMELGTAAQSCLNLFGESVLADKINAGFDAHGYLGSHIAFYIDEDFQKQVGEQGIDDSDALYHYFMSYKGSEDEKARKFWKHYRTFAKPTGLGYPGGLGAETFVAFAKSPYGVEVDVDTAKQLKEVWLETYPEFVKYFEWLNKEAKDPHFDGMYCYRTPMGMYRANCSYCAAANGNALQAFAAEGALLAVYDVTRKCYDSTQGSILGPDGKGVTTRAPIFVHDEIVGEVRDDEMAHDRVMEVARIMVENMQIITPDVAARAEPALMRRWDKRAEPVYDNKGRLTVWESDESEE